MALMAELNGWKVFFYEAACSIFLDAHAFCLSSTSVLQPTLQDQPNKMHHGKRWITELLVEHTYLTEDACGGNGICYGFFDTML